MQESDRAFAEKWEELSAECGCQADPGISPLPEWDDWTDFDTTPDQRAIERYLERREMAGRRILHVGIGNSSVAIRFAGRASEIAGLTVTTNELTKARRLNIANYTAVLHNKFDLPYPLDGPFDFVIDNNPTSFACCRHHVLGMMRQYRALIGDSGAIVTARIGLEHVMIEEGQAPGWSFTFDDWQQLARMVGLTAWKANNDVYGMSYGPPPKVSLRATTRWLAKAVPRKIGNTLGLVKT